MSALGQKRTCAVHKLMSAKFQKRIFRGERLPRKTSIG